LIRHWQLEELGFEYHVVAVFGSQSTGKSTLLNSLFGTTFDVMNMKQGRTQTTKGIWMSKAKDSEILVMDVEGTDGRERGEDQDFERKTALFSLATAEVVLINMWEHAVGLYNGANMSLLRTVLEVNLQLFSPYSFLMKEFKNVVAICLTRLNWGSSIGNIVQHPKIRFRKNMGWFV
jgi:hypothetical protein